MENQEVLNSGSVANLMKQELTPMEFGTTLIERLTESDFSYRKECGWLADDREAANRFLEFSFAWIWKISKETEHTCSDGSWDDDFYKVCDLFTNKTGLLREAGTKAPDYFSTAISQVRYLIRIGNTVRELISQFVFEFMVTYAERDKGVRKAVESMNRHMGNGWEKLI